MRSLIVYMSWTGCVAKLAERLQIQLAPFGDVAIERIVPTRQHSYWGWLIRSFLPGWRVTIQPIAAGSGDYDVVCLGFPKWTLSCPPVNQFIQSFPVSAGSRIGLFMSCGGFDHERYMKGMVKKLVRKGARVVAVTIIKRSAIRDERFAEEMERFCRRLL